MVFSLGPLPLAAGLLGVAALALVRAGYGRRRLRGWVWWVGATACGALGVGTAAWYGTSGTLSALHPLAGLLLAAWPLLLLAGMRRFHARLNWRTTTHIDGLVMALAGLALLLAWRFLPDRSAALLAIVACGLATHLYSAVALLGRDLQDDLPARRLLAVTIALAGLTPIAAWALSNSDADAALAAWQPVSDVLAVAICSFTLLAMMSDRAERDLRRSRRQLLVLANTDALTGVPNRRHFQDQARRVLQSPANRLPVLLLFDIDHFKIINDQLGHAAGDRALRLVGRCLDEALRTRDIAGRLGGDEFVLLLGEATMAQALGVAKRLVATLQASSIKHRLPCLALSFGLVQVQPGEAIDDAMRRADQALYEAKRQGRSRAVAAHGAEDEPVFSESQRLGLTIG